MNIGKTLYITKRSAWRAWLQQHHKTEPDIWLEFPKQASGKTRISYNDAVEEALCFGWIDSIVKKLHDNSVVQRFSPRNPKSTYSQPNLERLRKLNNAGKLSPEVKAIVTPLLEKPFTFPKDIIATIKLNPAAWQHYQAFPPAYKRIRIAFIDGSRSRPEEFKKRLKYFIAMCEKNKMFGFGGIDAYFTE
jgi:uncharacterized protein YdeI (YjbR/CyaY-like superfamily)